MSTGDPRETRPPEPAATGSATASADAPSSTSPAGDDPIAGGAALLSSLRDAAAGAAGLFAAELRRAGLSLGLMLAAAALLAMLLVSAWLLVCAALVAAAVAAGTSLASALLAVALANALGAGTCWLLLQALSRNLGFDASRRMLARAPVAGDADAPATA